MIIHKKPIEYYVSRLQNEDYFSFPGFGDSEWFCMVGAGRWGTESGFGQLHTSEAGRMLVETLRIKDDKMLFATPELAKEIFGERRLDRFLKGIGVDAEFYERDMVLDDLAEEAGLKPLIDQLQTMNVTLIGNPALRGCHFLRYNKFIETGSPNFHMDLKGMKDVVRQCEEPGVYLFSAGISSAIMIGWLHKKLKNSFLIDCGSIWDTFVGIGGQRQWRADLYNDPKKWLQWLQKNLT